MEYCEPDKCLSVWAIKQLWSWAGERKNISAGRANNRLALDIRMLYAGENEAYRDMMKKMRTLFAGLIDFE